MEASEIYEARIKQLEYEIIRLNTTTAIITDVGTNTDTTPCVDIAINTTAVATCTDATTTTTIITTTDISTTTHDNNIDATNDIRVDDDSKNSHDDEMHNDHNNNINNDSKVQEYTVKLRSYTNYVNSLYHHLKNYHHKCSLLQSMLSSMKNKNQG